MPTTNNNKETYYDLLELTEEDKKLQGDKFNEKVKKNYKKLALKYHPDRVQGSDEEKKQAEEKFKEISTAYSTLSDPKKRQEYDLYGEAGMHGRGFGFDPNDINSMMEEMMRGFGFNFGGRRQEYNSVVKGKSYRMTITATLEELYNGFHKKLLYKRNVVCTHCNGTGMEEGGQIVTCPECGGSGMKSIRNGMMLFQSTCPNCGGRGMYIDKPCHHCHGAGVVDDNSTVEFNVEPKTYPGTELYLPGMGGAPIRGEGENGDLYVIVKLDPRGEYQLERTDIIKKVDVPLVDCIIGGSVEVENIDKKKYKVTIKEGTRHGDRLKLSGKGWTTSQMRGDFIIVINQVMPKNLSKKSRQLLEDFKKSLGK